MNFVVKRSRMFEVHSGERGLFSGCDYSAGDDVYEINGKKLRVF